MKTVKEVASLSGVSVRTLHHYDAIGLLKPAQVTEAGYRLYDDRALERLQTILFFRQLQFPLKQIRQILDAPGFDPLAALEQQIALLELQREHLDNLIAHARQIQKTGVISMDFSPFDNRKAESYAAEVKKRWGATEAYREFEEKTKGQTPDRQKADGDGLMAIFARMGEIRHLSPASPEARALVQELQRYITDHYYNCTNQILMGLGQMYAAGDEMNQNIDAAGGEGTGAFARDAIMIYCRK